MKTIAANAPSESTTKRDNSHKATVMVGKSFDVCLLLATVLAVTSSVTPATKTKDRQRQVIDLDLRSGQVKGSSKYVEFIAPLSPSKRANCDGRAVLRIDMSGPFQTVRFVLRYARPRLWSFHVADTFSDGYGGGALDTRSLSTAEAHISNRQLRIYSNQLPGFHDATINGGLLLKVANNVVDANSSVTVQVSDERIEWEPQGRRKQFIESKFLYRLTPPSQTAAAADTEEDAHNDRFLYVGLNRVVADNFRRGSGLCQASVVLVAENVAHCKAKKNGCHKDAYCYDTRRSFRCRCNPGFYGNGLICEDDNECEYNNGGCIHLCTNFAGNYSCSCHAGFTLAQDLHDCVDVNECLVNNGGCEHECVNTLGSFTCRCPRGYILDPSGTSCIELDYCHRNYGCTQDCLPNSQQKCRCEEGYRLHENGRDCVRTCAIGNGGCHHVCHDTETGPVCTCHDNYIRNPDTRTCTVTCGVNNGGCDRRCNDTLEGPVCSCPDGYVLAPDAKTCLDIDECSLEGARCSHECINTQGSFECVCPHGYAVGTDRVSCVDVDECELNTTCDHICYNTPGSYTCQCYPGHVIYGQSHCADDDECAVDNGGCAHVCDNEEGGYTCSCRDGYNLHYNGRDCVEAISCASLRTSAHVDMACHVTGSETSCELSCTEGSTSVIGVSAMASTCGPDTGYRWSHDLAAAPLQSCSSSLSAVGYKRELSVMFLMGECDTRPDHIEAFKYDFVSTISDLLNGSCGGLCRITNVELICGTRRRKFDKYTSGTDKKIVQVRFTVHLRPVPLKRNCEGACTRRKTLVRMKKSLKVLRRATNKDWRSIRFAGQEYEGIRDSLKRTNPVAECPLGYILVEDSCVACSIGSYYDTREALCEPCVAGFYQDREGQISCLPCPHNQPGVGLPMATHESQCNELCEPGTFSPTGLKPCEPCPLGTYQRQHGRITCVSCGRGVSTSRRGATGFQHCQVNAHCHAGHYYDAEAEDCSECPRNSYQPAERQNGCLRCPGDTIADFPGSADSQQCKDTRCGGFTDNNQGAVQTPNWPGEYPVDAECTWSISPPKGRRILIVIPEIHLAAGDRCGDKLSMRKSASKYSLLTYETCEPALTPLAITAHSKKLHVHFTSDSHNTAQGFSIPYVMYDEEYQELIEDIVRDGRLYSLYQHQEVLKNRKLLAALLEVIAEPYKYFNYVNASESMFPDSFIRLLRNKVVRFFSRS